MRKYYIFIFLLCILSLGLAAAVIWQTGTPAKQKALQLDETRRSDFSSIAIEINNFYASNNELPKSLEEIQGKVHYVKIKDPESNKPYVYNVKSEKSYELCTTFSESYDENDSESISSPAFPYASEQNHKKGYDCLSHSVTENNGFPFKPLMDDTIIKKSDEVLTN